MKFMAIVYINEGGALGSGWTKSFEEALEDLKSLKDSDVPPPVVSAKRKGTKMSYNIKVDYEGT